MRAAILWQIFASKALSIESQEQVFPHVAMCERKGVSLVELFLEEY